MSQILLMSPSKWRLKTFQTLKLTYTKGEETHVKSDVRLHTDPSPPSLSLTTVLGWLVPFRAAARWINCEPAEAFLFGVCGMSSNWLRDARDARDVRELVGLAAFPTALRNCPPIPTCELVVGFCGIPFEAELPVSGGTDGLLAELPEATRQRAEGASSYLKLGAQPWRKVTQIDVSWIILLVWSSTRATLLPESTLDLSKSALLERPGDVGGGVSTADIIGV